MAVVDRSRIEIKTEATLTVPKTIKNNKASIEVQVQMIEQIKVVLLSIGFLLLLNSTQKSKIKDEIDNTAVRKGNIFPYPQTVISKYEKNLNTIFVELGANLSIAPIGNIIKITATHIDNSESNVYFFIIISSR